MWCMTTGEKIAMLLKQRGLKQKVLVERAALAVNKLTRVKAGESELAASEVLRVARTLGVSCDFLLDDELSDPKTQGGITPEQARLIIVAEELGYGEAMARLLRKHDPVDRAPRWLDEAPQPEPKPARKAQ